MITPWHSIASHLDTVAPGPLQSFFPQDGTRPCTRGAHCQELCSSQLPTQWVPHRECRAWLRGSDLMLSVVAVSEDPQVAGPSLAGMWKQEALRQQCRSSECSHVCARTTPQKLDQQHLLTPGIPARSNLGTANFTKLYTCTMTTLCDMHCLRCDPVRARLCGTFPYVEIGWVSMRCVTFLTAASTASSLT